MMEIKIVLKISDKEIILTEQEALELKDKLNNMFGKQDIVPYPVPTYPCPNYPIYPYPIITYYSGTSDNVNRFLC